MRLVAVFLLGLVASSAHAQSAITVGFPAPGSHIKLESPAGARHFGTLISASSDSIIFCPEEMDSRIALPTTRVAKLEVSSGKERRILEDALLGMVFTGGTAAAVAALTWRPEGDFYFTRGTTAAIIAVPAGILGAIAGAAIGAIPRDRWVRVPIPRM